MARFRSFAGASTELAAAARALPPVGESRPAAATVRALVGSSCAECRPERAVRSVCPGSVGNTRYTGGH